MVPVNRQPTDLRTRIANAIWEELRTQNNLVNFDRLADAVIRELNLTILGDGIVVGVIHV